MDQTLPMSVVESTLRICEGAATPRAVGVAILLRYGEWDQLVSLRVDPRRYDNAEAYYRDAVVTDLLRKIRGVPTSIDLHKEAVRSFFASEAQCYRSNERLSPYLEGASHPNVDERISSVIREVRKKVVSILGRPVKTIQGHFGPGATYADKGKKTTVAHKMSSNPTMTSRAWPYLFDWASTQWASALCARDDGSLTTVRGNRFTSVPKDSSKNRGICIEPSINIFYQLGLGLLMKKRLRAHGIELAVEPPPPLPDRLSDVLAFSSVDGQSLHSRKAKEASITGEFATIDLSSASDTVCYNLVKLLLPSDWFHLLDDLRSPYTLIEGRWVRLEKFSSMGNGYTFELETLIFLSLILGLASARNLDLVVGRDILVYGDDIIIPSHLAEDTLAMLRFFGFTPNASKTYVSGHFRESCGGDFFKGEDVRPYFLEEIPCEPQELMAFANGINRLRDRDFISHDFRDHLRRAWFCVLDAIPSHIRRCRGPRHLGDIVIHDEESRWSFSLPAEFPQMKMIRVYRPVRFRRIPWDHIPGHVHLACATLGYGDGALGVTPRDAVIGHKVGWVSVS